MFKKINQETLIRFGFFVIIFIFLYFFILILNPIFDFGSNSKPTLVWIFWVFFMLPAYITNVMTNIDKLNLFDHYYFWSVQSTSNILFVFFWFFGCLYFAFILTLLSGDNKRIKNIIWKFHFYFFTYAIILKAVYFYLKYPDPTTKVVIGSSNLPVILSEIIFIAINIYILSRIKTGVDFEFLKETTKKYFFMISELLLVLLVALTFKDYLLASDASVIDRVSNPLSYFFYGFFIFLCLQLIRIHFKERL